MDVADLLKKKGIEPSEPALLITAEDALEYLLEAIEEYCPNLEVDKMSKKDLQALLNSYAECVILYHPEDSHQERAVLLKHFEMLKKYGLGDEDFSSIDFC